MTEIKTEVKTHMVRSMCACGGEFIATGLHYTNGYPQSSMFGHACNKCGVEDFFGKEYPYVDYEEVSNDI